MNKKAIAFISFAFAGLFVFFFIPATAQQENHGEPPGSNDQETSARLDYPIRPVPGDLYRYVDPAPSAPQLQVAG